MKHRRAPGFDRSKAFAQAPPEVYQAKAAFERNDLVGTIRFCQQALERDPKDINALHLLGKSLSLGGRFPEAEKFLQQVAKLQPRSASIRFSLAQNSIAQGQSKIAMQRLEKAIKLDPQHAEARIEQAKLLERLGRYAAARRAIGSSSGSVQRHPRMIEARAQLALHEDHFEDAIELVKQHADNASLGAEIRSKLWLIRGRAHDKLGQYDEAMHAWNTANEISRQSFNSKEFAAAVNREVSFFTRERLSKLPRGSDRTELPVFIAGMPRSGTTLVEQIIDAHPQAIGAGELRDLELYVQALPEQLHNSEQYPLCLHSLTQDVTDRFASQYLARLRAMCRPETARVVNKSLENYRLLGLVAVLFPGARIILCRRDPIDTCLSIYMQWFHPHKYPFATDLGNLGVAHREADRLLAHWKSVLDLPILEVQYEELVASPDEQSRRLIGFLELEWDDACRHFYESGRTVMTLSYHQVSKPIYSSAVKRNERYRKHLDPLLSALGHQTDDS